LLSVKLRAGVVDAVATEVVNSGLRFPAEKLETVPVVGVPTNCWTHAVVASAVELSVGGGVGPCGVPVKIGLKSGAAPVMSETS
jgi:hypothetical protein